MSESAVPNASSPKPADEFEALPAGTRLSEFEIKGVLGRGGFGIVYLAADLSLQRQVAIKEYLPAALAGRRADGRLAVHCAAFAEAFEMGLRSFVNESRLLARFDHPALVKVHRFWEANNTAYMVMPYYQGVTLTQVRQSMSEPPSQTWLRRILNALLGALDVIHHASVVHRDVAPDNIVLLASGSPVLLDFGAARHVLEDRAQEITALVKPAYAPIEQYAVGSHFGHGPWTDIYGVAATLHYCLTGKPPPTAAARIIDDDYEPLGLSRALLELPSGEPYDRRWLNAIDWGLAVKPQDRPQSIASWQRELEQHSAAQAPRRTHDRAQADAPHAVAIASLTALAARPRQVVPNEHAQADAFARTQADPPVAAQPARAPRGAAAAHALAATTALASGVALHAKAQWSSRLRPSIAKLAVGASADLRASSAAAARSCADAWARSKLRTAEHARTWGKALPRAQDLSFDLTQPWVKALPWLTAGVALGVLASLGWRAATPPAPALVPAAALAPRPALDTVRRPATPPAAATAAAMPAAVALPPRPMSAVHTRAAVDDDDEVEKPDDDATAADAPPPGKRKAKALRARPSMISVAEAGTAARPGPQVVEANREPAWTRLSVATPRDLCAGQRFLNGLTCMRRACADPKWSKHAQCVHWHSMERRYMADSR